MSIFYAMDKQILKQFKILTNILVQSKKLVILKGCSKHINNNEIILLCLAVFLVYLKKKKNQLI